MNIIQALECAKRGDAIRVRAMAGKNDKTNNKHRWLRMINGKLYECVFEFVLPDGLYEPKNHRALTHLPVEYVLNKSWQIIRKEKIAKP